MSLWDSWEKWSLRQWFTWGSKLQSKYDEYREFKTPDWYLDLTESVWENLSNSAKDYLNRFVIETCKTFDETFAKELIDNIVKKIKERLGL